MAGRRKGRSVLALLGALLFLALLVLYDLHSGNVLRDFFGLPERPSPGIAEARTAVHLIDVGQGDAVYIRAGGKDVLIDAGEKENGRTDVVRYLRSLGVKRIDVLVASHPHSDHIGGMEAVVRSFEIGKVVMPRLREELTPATDCYRDLLTAVKEKGLTVSAAQDLGEIPLSEDGKTKLSFLGPRRDHEDLNDMSVCVRFETEGFSALFCGDAEEAAEEDLLSSGADLSCDLLKLSHHGSAGSNLEAFLDAASPELFAVSAGAENEYGHPSGQVLERIRRTGKPLYRTDLQGTVVFLPESGTVRVVTER